jgi:multicomponent Na+:H+ antiporter subunit G
MGVLEAFGSLLLVLGCVLALTGSLGVLRMPDFYSRLHPAGKTDTLGQLLMLSGLLLFAAQQILTLLLSEDAPEDGALLGWANVLLKVLLVSVLLFVTAPTSTHAIAKAARLDPHTKIPVEGDPAQQEDPR